jgi:hypothetical protein
VKSLEQCVIDKPAITNIRCHRERLKKVLNWAVFASAGATPGWALRASVVRYLIFLARMLIYGAIWQIGTDKLGASYCSLRATAGFRDSWEGGR